MTENALAAAQRLFAQAVEVLRGVVEAGSASERVAVLTLCEGVARQLGQVTVTAVAGLDRDGVFVERGYKSPAQALSDLVGWERFEAHRRVTAAEHVAPRIGLDGTVLPARLSAMAEQRHPFHGMDRADPRRATGVHPAEMGRLRAETTSTGPAAPGRSAVSAGPGRAASAKTCSSSQTRSGTPLRASCRSVSSCGRGRPRVEDLRRTVPRTGGSTPASPHGEPGSVRRARFAGGEERVERESRVGPLGLAVEVVLDEVGDPVVAFSQRR